MFDSVYMQKNLLVAAQFLSGWAGPCQTLNESWSAGEQDCVEPWEVSVATAQLGE